MPTFRADIRGTDHHGPLSVFATDDRATAIEAHADAMRLVGCATIGEAVARLGLPGIGLSSAEAWLPLDSFVIERWHTDGDQDHDYDGPSGEYLPDRVCRHCELPLTGEPLPLGRTLWVNTDHGSSVFCAPRVALLAGQPRTFAAMKHEPLIVAHLRPEPASQLPAPTANTFAEAERARAFLARMASFFPTADQDDEADASPRGRCDSCGAPCDPDTGDCTSDVGHLVAIPG